MVNILETTILSDNSLGLDAEDLIDSRQAKDLLKHAFSPAEVQGDAVPAGTRICSWAVLSGHSVTVKRIRTTGYNVAGAGGHRFVLADVAADNVGVLAAALQTKAWQQIVGFPHIECGTKNKALMSVRNTGTTTRYLLMAASGNFLGVACNAITEFFQGSFDVYDEVIA